MYTPFMKLWILSFGIDTVLEERCFSIAHTEMRKEEGGSVPSSWDSKVQILGKTALALAFVREKGI